MGILNQMLSGGGAELCAPILQTYQSIHNAPVYSVQGQPTQIQQAYDLYRQAISTLDGRSDSFLQCGASGGSIGNLDIGETIEVAQKSVGLLARALELAKSVSQTTASPLESAILRMRLAVSDISGQINRFMPYYKSAYSDYMCPQILASDAALQPIELDVSSQPQNVRTAYDLYRQAVVAYRVGVSELADTCRAGDHPIDLPLLKSAYLSVSKVINLLSSAYDALKQ